jgi:hypothetical protein
MSKIKKQIVDEIQRGARKNYPRRRVILKAVDDTWFVDLINIPAYAKDNDQYKHILVIVDGLSKKGRAVGLKTKSSREVAAAFQKIFERGIVPKNINSDMGTEFKMHAAKLFRQYNVNHYVTYSRIHSSLAERWIRTLMGSLWKKFHMRASHRWIDILNTTVKEYNQKIHRTIGMAPDSVTKKHETYLLKKIYETDIVKPRPKPKFKVGDTVRISRLKHIFEKKYYGNWSTELFKIIEVRKTLPPTYKIEDSHGQKILGGFYEQELQKTKHDDVYLVEKVLKYSKSKKKAFVRWLGFKNKFDSWINTEEII